ncbi:MAG: tRNA (adenosine(37)-N6)-threonylcarbamoyltransferase complex ATPase subunit type 1 TsaE [Proteobacteria bacterium]|nr:tRNA (adenosine(37)-N6)-threonylcarbamoyltransferase complex ATPase subunit type 1 TsaE [Pseudomonadota bacterium]
MIEITIDNEQQMLELGERLGAALDGHGAVHLAGDLGAGKTTLSRGIVRSYGYEGAVKSPTFTLVEPYNLEQPVAVNIYHFDLYRLSSPDELDYIGVDDYFSADALCLIEWPEKAEGFLPEHDLYIRIDVSGETRNIYICGTTAHGERVCEKLRIQYES